jgi:hypothetical protein
MGVEITNKFSYPYDMYIATAFFQNSSVLFNAYANSKVYFLSYISRFKNQNILKNQSEISSYFNNNCININYFLQTLYHSHRLSKNSVDFSYLSFFKLRINDKSTIKNNSL